MVIGRSVTRHDPSLAVCLSRVEDSRPHSITHSHSITSVAVRVECHQPPATKGNQQQQQKRIPNQSKLLVVRVRVRVDLILLFGRALDGYDAMRWWYGVVVRWHGLPAVGAHPCLVRHACASNRTSIGRWPSPARGRYLPGLEQRTF